MAQGRLVPAVQREVAPATIRSFPQQSERQNLSGRKSLLMSLALVFAAATITYSFVWMYYVRWAPNAEIGVDTRPLPSAANALEIINVYPGSPAERSGIRVRDQIVAIDGRSLAHAGPDLLESIWLHRSPGDMVTLTIRRPGQAEPLHITAAFRAVPGPGSIKSIADQIIGSYPLPFLVVGIVVLLLRLEERNAWLLAFLCASFISVSDIPPSAVMMSPGLHTFMMAYRAIFLGMLAFTFYTFFARFPERSALDRRFPLLKWLIGAIGMSMAVPAVRLGRPEPWSAISRLTGQEAAQYALMAYIYGTILLTLASLLWSAVRVFDLEAKRKLRVVIWGTLVGVTPATITKFISDFAGIRVPFWIDVTDVVLVTLFPLSFAYAVVRHRVMDVPVLLKQSARYLLVRRGFIFLLVLLALSVNLVLGIGLSRMFQMYPALAMSIGGTFGIALAWISAPRVRRAAARIDRAFFRGAYDARVILQQLAQSVARIASKEELPPLIEKELQQALFPSSMAIYLRDSGGSLQATPCKPFLEAIPCDSGDRLWRLNKPIDTSEYGDFSSLIPELAPLHPECLVPLPSRSGETLGLIVLGAKQSEEPYSSEDKELLGSVAAQAGLALDSIQLAEKMAERMEAERRAEQELEIARVVQSKLLPQQSPPLATLDYAGACIQARAVGGDYYDFLDLGPGRVGFVLADIAGKGISGALLMANLQASLRSLYSLAERDLPQFLESVNRLFVRNTETTHYATAFIGIYDDESRAMRYANCGHNPPLLLRAGGVVERLQATATVLGLFEGWECSVAEVSLSPGDILAIYTDGITEACNPQQEEFGEDRLIEVLRLGTGLSATDLLLNLVKSVQSFSPTQQADDLTAIVAVCR